MYMKTCMFSMYKKYRFSCISCIKHACFHIFFPFSAYFSPHDIIAEKGGCRSGTPRKGRDSTLFVADL